MKLVSKKHIRLHAMAYRFAEFSRNNAKHYHFDTKKGCATVETPLLEDGNGTRNTHRTLHDYGAILVDALRCKSQAEVVDDGLAISATVEATILSTNPYLTQLQGEVDDMQHELSRLDSQKDAAKRREYQHDMAMIRGFILACVAQQYIAAQAGQEHVIYPQNIQLYLSKAQHQQQLTSSYTESDHQDTQTSSSCEPLDRKYLTRPSLREATSFADEATFLTPEGSTTVVDYPFGCFVSLSGSTTDDSSVDVEVADTVCSLDSSKSSHDTDDAVAVPTKKQEQSFLMAVRDKFVCYDTCGPRLASDYTVESLHSGKRNAVGIKSQKKSFRARDRRNYSPLYSLGTLESLDAISASNVYR